MERVGNENDIFHLMAKFDFEKLIKTTCVIEDTDETNIVENLQLTKKPVQYASQNINNTNSATELLTTLSSNHNYYNNVSFDENRFNFAHERRNYSDEITTHNRNVQNQHTGYSYAMPHNEENDDPLRNMVNNTNRIPNQNYLTNNEQTYQNLLDTVSENLIIITKYYHFYNLKYENHYSNAREEYQKYKNHYFDQSYNVLVSLFLPHEHNQAFIRNFITRTIYLANRKSWYNHMTTSTLEDLVKAMIQWAKNKKEYQEASGNQLQQSMMRPPPLQLVPPVPPVPPVPASSNSNLDISAQKQINKPPPKPHTQPVPLPPYCDLNLPPALPSSNKNLNDDARKSKSKLLPTSSAAALAVTSPSNSTFNVPPVLPSSNSNINVNALKSISKPPLTSPAIPVPSLLNNNFDANVQKSSTKPPPISTALPVPPFTNNFNCYAQQSMSRSPTNPLIPPALPPQSSNSISNVNTSYQSKEKSAKDHTNNICLFSTGPPGNEIRISIDSSVAKTVIGERVKKKVREPPEYYITSKKRRSIDDTGNPSLLYTNSTWYSRPIRPNPIPHNIYNHHSQNQPPPTSDADSINARMQSVNNSNQLGPGARQNDYELDNNESQPPLISRSVSRDSGFGSPVLCSLLTNNDHNNMAYPHSTDNEESTPEITHVTSLNPDAVYIASGTCKICGSTTKNVCIVCYNVYYCGYVCQTLDWPHHQLECRER